MNKLWANLKSWYGVLLLVLLAGGVLWFVLNGMTYINSLRTNWEAQRLQAQWEKPYREDKYGGKTPEETYDMFLSALKEGNVELASKYFVVDEQEKWEKTLEEYKKQNLLGDLSAELKDNQKSWALSKNDGQVATYVYSYVRELPKETELPVSESRIQKIILPPGTFMTEIIFELNTYTKIWKISVL